MIPSETNLPQFWRHPPTNTQPFHPDLLSPNRSTSLTTETDTLVSRSLVIYSVVVFGVGPLHWKEKKNTSESSAPRHLPSYKSHYTDRTLDHSPLFTVISGVLLFRVDPISDEPSTWRRLVQIPANNWNKLAVGSLARRHAKPWPGRCTFSSVNVITTQEAPIVMMLLSLIYCRGSSVLMGRLL